MTCRKPKLWTKRGKVFLNWARRLHWREENAFNELKKTITVQTYIVTSLFLGKRYAGVCFDNQYIRRQSLSKVTMSLFSQYLHDDSANRNYWSRSRCKQKSEFLELCPGRALSINNIYVKMYWVNKIIKDIK